MDRKGFFIQSVLKLFFVAMITELLFRLFTFSPVFDFAMIRITLFCFAYSLITAAVCSLLPQWLGKTIVLLLNIFIPVYAFFQLGYNELMGHYVSLKSAGQGAKTGSYVGPFFQAVKPWFYTIFIAPLIAIIWSIAVREHKEPNRIGIILFLVIGLVLNAGGTLTVYASQLSTLYNNPVYINKSFMEFGLARFLVRDMTSEFRNTDDLVDDETDEEPEDTVDPNIRQIDDSEWIAAMESEEDENIKKIDSYLMSRSSSKFNDMTGYYEGKNFVYILVESLDYMAFDEALTPTLCKLRDEGWFFSNHYTPRYNCTTGDTGFITEVDLIPDNAICTENEYANNAWPNGIYQQFANKGYTTSAFHNWKDEYYERRIYYTNEGCQVYKNYDDLNIHTLTGWQSDLELMQLAVPKFIKQEKFMTAIITSAMHYPYSKYSVLGDRYLDQINKVHPDYPDMVKRYLSKCIDFDKSLEYLLSSLEKAGKLEDTVIMIFNDHHPFEMTDEMIAKYCNTSFDRLEGLNIDRGIFMVYCASDTHQEYTGVTSTFDILPTMLNLFNIQYDPRLYFGADYFSEKEKIVYMPEGDWISNEGIYYMESDTFVGGIVGPKYVSNINTQLKNMTTISKMIYKSDYFAKRGFITNPEYLNTAPVIIERQMAAEAAAMAEEAAEMAEETGEAPYEEGGGQ